MWFTRRRRKPQTQYIEKTVHKIGKKHHVTVATSDGLEQMIIWGEGALRMSAPGFLEEVRAVSAQSTGAISAKRKARI